MYVKGTDIDYLKKQIEKKLKHPYLQKYIEQTVIEEEKIIVLDSLFHNFPQREREKYIVTVILVQIALNIHDTISVEPEFPDHTDERVSKQLSVLAGDYYSGLYYLLLSELEDFTMIHTLAVAIKQINELKMKVYYGEYKSIEEFFSIIEKINSALLTHVAEHLEENSFNTLISEWLLLNKLIHERDNQLHSSPLVINWLHGSSIYSKETIDIFFDKKIASLIINLKRSIHTIPDKYGFLKRYITKWLEILNHDATISIMEEG